MIKNLMNLLFPSLCPGCKALLLAYENTICTKCRHNLPLTNHFQTIENEVFKKFYGRIELQHASAIVYFRKAGITQELIHALKYRGEQEIGTLFAQLYSKELETIQLKEKFDQIIPVPLHPKRLRERGYNQIDTFGKTVAEALSIPFNKTLLKRNQYSKTQSKKSLLSRTDITSSLFQITDVTNYHGQHFLLVDDVLTSGATIEACGKALLKIPGVKVSVITIAFADS